MKRFQIILYIFLFPVLSGASTSNQSVVESARSGLEFKPSAGFLIGSTSNATRLGEPTPGYFGKVVPSAGLEYSPSDSFFVIGTLKAELKRFSDPTVGAIANETIVDGKADISLSIDDSESGTWEVGSHLGLGYTENQIPIVGSQTIQSQRQQYYQPDIRLYGARIGEAWSLDLGASGSTRRYSTTTFDIQGNVYKDTFNEYRADGTIGYRWSKGLRFYLKTVLQRRFYLERMAEFSDGLPPPQGSPHSKLVISSGEVEPQLKSSIRSIPLTSAVSFRAEKDHVYGARDSLRLKVRQNSSIHLPFSIVFEPEISVARQAFSRFRADPIVDPKNSPLRVDWDLQALAAVTRPFGKVLSVRAQYAFNRKISNYTIQNYLEHVVETGMALQL
ncbi:MAG: hypothetical protein AB7F43_07115 [Bacteriovoracia bacterium]